MSLLAVIGVVLVILKLSGLIAMSWGLVLLPFYITPLIWIIVITFGACAAAGSGRKIHRKRRW
ncbi:hypothetical protein NoPa_00055 [Pseudomonas phage vB_PpuM-NoPa]|uniref:Uncharacterized protein n=1 Tax=Pseudomonas phage vB_PpuM-NoPa TaxID=3132619 RepID=A0AAX4MY96_9CAUD